MINYEGFYNGKQVRISIPESRPEINLIGQNGNAWSIMDRARTAMRKHGFSKDLLDQYMREAMSGDYNNLLNITSQYCITELSDD